MRLQKESRFISSKEAVYMQINLINGYYIEVSNRNFTLRQKYVGTSKDGNKKEYSKIISHCGSMEQALETFCA